MRTELHPLSTYWTHILTEYAASRGVELRALTPDMVMRHDKTDSEIAWAVARGYHLIESLDDDRPDATTYLMKILAAFYEVTNLTPPSPSEYAEAWLDGVPLPICPALYATNAPRFKSLAHLVRRTLPRDLFDSIVRDYRDR